MNLYKWNATKPCRSCSEKNYFLLTVKSFFSWWQMWQCETEPVCSRWTSGWECSEARTQAGWLTGWLGCVFWALVSILFKLGPRPQTSRKPFITLCREGNVGKNQADHVAPSLATESWPAPLLLLQSPRPGNTHSLTQTASTPLVASSSRCHSLRAFPPTRSQCWSWFPKQILNFSNWIHYQKNISHFNIWKAFHSLSWIPCDLKFPTASVSSFSGSCKLFWKIRR